MSVCASVVKDQESVGLSSLKTGVVVEGEVLGEAVAVGSSLMLVRMSPVDAEPS